MANDRQHPRPTAGEIAARTILVTATAAGTLALLLFAWRARQIVFATFAAVLLAILLHAAGSTVGRWLRVGDRWGVVVSAVAALVLLVLLVIWRGPETVSELGTLREQIPEALSSLREQIQQTELGRRAMDQVPESVEEAIPDMSSTAQTAGGLAIGAAGALAMGFVVLFLGLLFALTPGVYIQGGLLLVPRRSRAAASDILDRIGDALRRWLGAQLIAMVAVFAMVWAGLSIIGMPLAFTLGLIAGLLDFVPYLGPIVSGIPAVLLAFVAGPDKLLWVLVLYIVVQSIESYVIGPVLQWKVVYIPPALTIVAQIALGTVAGLWGVALAAPLTAALMVLGREMTDGDPDAGAEGKAASGA